MKKLIVVIMLILSGGCVFAQHTADLGVQLSAATYWGDIQKQNNAKSVTPVVGILGRWNFNKRLAIRGQLLTGNLKAEGIFNNTLIGQSGVNASMFPATPDFAYNFTRSFQTVESLFEFNFRNYRFGKKNKEAFTPFVAVGLGAFYSRAPRKGSFILDPNEIINPLTTLPYNPAQYPPFVNPLVSPPKRTNGFDVLTLTIPVSVGLKFNITKRLGGIVEATVRKTFSDNIDNLNDPKRLEEANAISINNSSFLTYADAQTGLNKNDWFATLSVSLTWQLWSDKGNCAIYDKIKRTK